MKTQAFSLVVALAAAACAHEAPRVGQTTVTSSTIAAESPTKTASLALKVDVDHPETCPEHRAASVTLESSDIDMIGTEQVQKWASCLMTPQLERDVVRVEGDPDLVDTVREAIVTRGIHPARVIAVPQTGADERVTISLLPR